MHPAYLVQMDAPHVLDPAVKGVFLFLYRARLLGSVAALNEFEIRLHVIAEFRRVREDGQVVVIPPDLQPVHFLHGLGDGLNRTARLVHQGDAPGLFLASVPVLECQLRVVASITDPKSAYRLLASVQDFGKLSGMRLTVAVSSLFAFCCVSFHAATLAQLLAQSQTFLRNSLKITCFAK